MTAAGEHSRRSLDHWLGIAGARRILCGNLLVHRAHASKVRLRVALPLPINSAPHAEKPASLANLQRFVSRASASSARPHDHSRRNTTLRLFAGISVITGAENPTDRLFAGISVITGAENPTDCAPDDPLGDVCRFGRNFLSGSSRSLGAGASVTGVALRHGVNANLLFTWRGQKGAEGVADMGSSLRCRADRASCHPPTALADSATLFHSTESCLPVRTLKSVFFPSRQKRISNRRRPNRRSVSVTSGSQSGSTGST